MQTNIIAQWFVITALIVLVFLMFLELRDLDETNEQQTKLFETITQILKDLKHSPN